MYDDFICCIRCLLKNIYKDEFIITLYPSLKLSFYVILIHVNHKKKRKYFFYKTLVHLFLVNQFYN